MSASENVSDEMTKKAEEILRAEFDRNAPITSGVRAVVAGMRWAAEECEWAERGFHSGLRDAARLADERAKEFDAGGLPVVGGAFEVFARKLRALAAGASSQPEAEAQPHDKLLEMDEAELRALVGDAHFEDLVKRGRDVVERALASVPAPPSSSAPTEAETFRCAEPGCDRYAFQDTPPHPGWKCARHRAPPDAAQTEAETLELAAEIMRREGIREATPAELDSDADKLRSKRRSELAQPAEQEPSGFAKYGYPHALLDPAEQEPSFIAELPSERDNAIAIVREMRANAEQELRGDVPTKTVGTDRSASAERDVFERFSEDYCITPSEVTLAVFARTRFGDAVKALEFYAAQDGQPRGPGATIAWKAREALALLSPPDAGGKKEL